MTVTMTVHGGHRLRRYMTNVMRDATTAQSVDVGFRQGSTYDDGKSVPMVATVNEFGLGVPERPFMRKAAEMMLRDPQLVRMMSTLIEPIGPGNRIRVKPWAWIQLGLYGQGKIQQSITDLKYPPNAPATIARKGSSDPLIDTGHMRQSVMWQQTPFENRQRQRPRGVGGRPRRAGGLRNNIYRSARVLGDVQALRSGGLARRFASRGAGRFASRGTGATIFAGAGAGSFGSGRGYGGFGGGFGGGGGGGLSSVRGFLYGSGRLLGDVEAVRGGTVGQRGVRRVTGKARGAGLGSTIR